MDWLEELLLPAVVVAIVVFAIWKLVGASRPKAGRVRAEIAAAMSEFGTRRDEWVIVDTETTGLSETDVVIDLAVVSGRGEVLLNTFVKLPPRKRISAGAAKAHGITREQLNDGSEWSVVRAHMQRVIGDRECIAFNAGFDKRLVEQTDRAHGVTGPTLRWVDIMPVYNNFVGEWDSYRNKVKWQKLPAGDHSAAGDCMAVYKLMLKMGLPQV